MRVDNASRSIPNGEVALVREAVRSNSSSSIRQIHESESKRPPDQSLTAREQQRSGINAVHSENQPSQSTTASHDKNNEQVASTIAASKTEEAQEPVVEKSFSDQLRVRDFEMRLYELDKSVKGVQHAGHIAFVATRSADGQNHVVDRESSREKSDATNQTQEFIEALQENRQKINDAKKAKEAENNELNKEVENISDEDRKPIANQMSNEKSNLFIETARERLEEVFNAAKPLIQQANFLGYVSPDSPHGPSGLIDIVV